MLLGLVVHVHLLLVHLRQHILLLHHLLLLLLLLVLLLVGVHRLASVLRHKHWRLVVQLVLCLVRLLLLLRWQVLVRRRASVVHSLHPDSACLRLRAPSTGRHGCPCRIRCIGWLEGTPRGRTWSSLRRGRTEHLRGAGIGINLHPLLLLVRMLLLLGGRRMRGWVLTVRRRLVNKLSLLVHHRRPLPHIHGSSAVLVHVHMWPASAIAASLRRTARGASPRAPSALPEIPSVAIIRLPIHVVIVVVVSRRSVLSLVVGRPVTAVRAKVWAIAKVTNSWVVRVSWTVLTRRVGVEAAVVSAG